MIIAVATFPIISSSKQQLKRTSLLQFDINTGAGNKHVWICVRENEIGIWGGLVLDSTLYLMLLFVFCAPGYNVVCI